MAGTFVGFEWLWGLNVRCGEDCSSLGGLEKASVHCAEELEVTALEGGCPWGLPASLDPEGGCWGPRCPHPPRAGRRPPSARSG